MGWYVDDFCHRVLLQRMLFQVLTSGDGASLPDKSTFGLQPHRMFGTILLGVGSYASSFFHLCPEVFQRLRCLQPPRQ